uniref:Peptidase C1A papain C-terminal domain-containing protein n=1 Tax=Chromera velia CCMP2878 TaxID=1169474 RepID=A0A0G4GSY4_9ALVE|mmetsp:Transcript_49615/g.97779  ORF Transcript_49615/g.97779 Transcript_49615/m.97779 type:complete len:416 (-) Transcript_49615:1274-2521(-)|eukprot:Cvel_23254.t1-p1 / transcript=Cvel_23254.t1 / gene=Cvel_23254 / organism=Chromera_velia_CCMP2878 / gene_product=Thiol protease aleurain, putative / transcript_product=Thiol protease aleurain, putative / location=Cvel_scaffold2376:24490-25734(+) / protein_length=415 / sequence_SO=supercontig / SO=protein_coding / is_pseudo=false
MARRAACLLLGFLGTSCAEESVTAAAAEGEAFHRLRFKRFTERFDKQYETPEEHELRFGIWQTNLAKIQDVNSNPHSTWTARVNEHADLTFEEFAAKFLMDENAAQNCSATAKDTSGRRLRGQSPPESLHSMLPRSKSLPINAQYAPFFDWRAYKVVTELKNQGSCGSCWTFSTTGALEAHTALKAFRETHEESNLPDLSEQQLIDCARDFNNFGCNGGLPSQAFEYIKYAGGLYTDAKYPYIEGSGGEHPERTCQFKGSKSSIGAVVPGGAVNITADDESELLDAVALVGPVSIAFEVTDDFRFYSSGVYTNPKCHSTPDKVNHAVLAVGFGTTEDGDDFWVVKNSWGSTWGARGYFNIARGQNMCGVATCASYPDVYGDEGRAAVLQGGEAWTHHAAAGDTVVEAAEVTELRA